LTETKIVLKSATKVASKIARVNGLNDTTCNNCNEVNYTKIAPHLLPCERPEAAVFAGYIRAKAHKNELQYVKSNQIINLKTIFSVSMFHMMIAPLVVPANSKGDTCSKHVTSQLERTCS